MSVHQKQHGCPAPLESLAHGDVHFIRRDSQIRWWLALDGLVALVLILRERLAVLEASEQPDEEPKEHEGCQTRDEHQAFDVQTGAHIAAVKEHVFLDVRLVGERVDVSGAPLPSQRAAVEVAQRLWILHGVDLLSWTQVLTIFIGLVEYLVLPHVEVQDEDQEDDSIIKPFPWGKGGGEGD